MSMKTEPMLYRLCSWIGKKTGTVILTPCPYAVGNCAVEIYFGLLKARREGKKLVVLFPYELPWKLKFHLTNIELVNVESEYRYPLNKWIYVTARLLLSLYFAFFRAINLVLQKTHLVLRKTLGWGLDHFYKVPVIGLSTLWQPKEKMSEFSWDVVEQYDWKRQMETPLQISLGKNKKLVAERQRIRMGLPEDAWFVCLHVREGGWRNANCPEREADIFNYLGAIEEITGRGGWVVRMGDATMTRLPTMDRVIDYPFTESKSDLMDIYLISECRFYIATLSGIHAVAELFQRPMVITNMYTWIASFPPKRCDIGVMKHLFSKSRNRFLSLREWLNEPWESMHYRTLGDDYVLYENSAEELTTVVREFLGRGVGWEPSSLQLQFNECRVLSGRNILSGPIFSGDDRQQRDVVPFNFTSEEFVDLLHRYYLASKLDSAVGVVGEAFLEKNWEHSVREEPNCVN